MKEEAESAGTAGLVMRRNAVNEIAGEQVEWNSFLADNVVQAI
jgi:hypothetical protein